MLGTEGDVSVNVDDSGSDVFISFVTDPDYAVAKKVREFLESFDRRVRRSGFVISRISAFVDSENLAARTTDADDKVKLSDSIRAELIRCRHLLVLCSFGTPNSTWVRREIEWYIQARGIAQVLLAVTEDIDPITQPEKVFPRLVLDQGLHQYLWYDLRGARTRRPSAPRVRPLEDVLTQLAAHLTGKAVADVTSAWYREQRRLARNRTIYVSIAGCAALAAVISGYQAYLEYKDANRSAAEKFLQSGIRSEAEGDLFGAREAFRSSLRLADTSVARVQLAEVTDLPILPKTTLDFSPVKGRNDQGLTAMAFTGDNTAVMGGKQGNLQLINFTDNTIAWSNKLSAGISALASAPDAGRVAVGLEDGHVLWINPQNGQSSEYKKFEQPIRGLRLDRSGQRLAVGLANDGGIQVVTADGKELLNLSVHADTVQGITFNKPGDYVYWGGSGPYIWGCDLASSASSQCQRITAVDQFVYSIDGSENTRYSAAAVGERVLLFDHALQKMTTIGELPGAHGYTIAFDPSNEYLAVGGSDGVIRVYDVQSGRMILNTRSHQAEVYSVAFNPLGNILVSVGLDGKVAVWAVDRAGIVMPPHNFKPSPQMLTLPQHNQIIDLKIIDDHVALVIAWDQRIRQYDLTTLKPYSKELDDAILRKGLSWAFAHAAKGPQFSQFGEMATWKTGLGSGAKRTDRYDGQDVVTTISADGRFLAVLSKDGSGEILDSTTNDAGRLSSAGSSPAVATFIAGKAPSLAVGYGDGTIRVFDGASFVQLFSSAVHRGAVQLILSSESCHCIYTTGQDGWLRAFDVADGHELHAAEVVAPDAMAITGDGKVLAVGGLTGQIELFDGLSMRQLARLPGNRGGTTVLGFNPSGTHLYSGGFDEVVRHWDVAKVAKVSFGSVPDLLAATASNMTAVVRMRPHGGG
jgi:WD40 repeat protein